MNETVTLTHPDGHGPIEVGARRARILARQGWVPQVEAPVTIHRGADAPDTATTTEN